MTNAFAPFTNLLRFRTQGDDRFQASCPTSAHPRGDRSRGLSGRVFGTKVVLKCFAGCQTADILSAMGLEWGALFADGTSQPRPSRHHDPHAVLRQSAATDCQRRETEMMQCATELRDRDHIIRLINNSVETGSLSINEAFGMLGYQYRGYSELDYQFETLRGETNAEARELRSVANDD